eukprot:2847034-Pleurochrysis_carterae.AAC.1
MAAAMLVVDYYCEVGVRDRLTIAAANAATVAERSSAGADAEGHSPNVAEELLLGATFEPSVLMRLPETDRETLPFATEVSAFCRASRIVGASFNTDRVRMWVAPQVAMFVFPHGVKLVLPAEAAANAMPVVTSFVLTAGDQSRMYGACIV